MRNPRLFRPTLNERLEDRTVPSGFHASHAVFQTLPTVTTSTTGAFPGGPLALGPFGPGSFHEGGENGSFDGPPGLFGREHGGQSGASSTLSQDARLVQQAFQTFDSAYLAAQAALRLTATATTAPTAAGLTAFDSAIATAVGTLNASISTDLANLTNTGTALNTTIDGFTATLQNEVDSAATGLTNSSNAAVRSLNEEVNTYLRSAVQQSTSAVLADAPSGRLTSATLQTYNSAVRAAYQAFSVSINSAEQTAIKAGSALDSTAVSSAVSTLQSSLNGTITGLGTAFSSSTYNPTSAIATDLANLTTQLTAVAAPTAGSSSSAHLFARSVSSVVGLNLSQINQAVLTGIQGYNNSLL